MRKYLIASFFSGKKTYRKIKIGIILVPAVVSVWIAIPHGVPVTSPAGWEKAFRLIPANVNVMSFDVFSKGNFTVISFEGEEKGQRNIYSASSVNGGSVFFAPRLIASYAVRDDFPRMNPCTAISSDGRVFTVWQGYSAAENSYRIFYSYSLDFGATFSEPQKLVFQTEMDFVPLIFFDDLSRLHIIYHSFENEQFNLYQSVSDRDFVFKTSVKITNLGKDFRGAFFPSIAITGKEIVIVWQGKVSRGGVLNDDIFVMNSSDHGMTFTGFRNVTESPGNDSRPSVAVIKDRIYCFFQNNDSGNWKINYCVSGESDEFSKPFVLFETNANCYFPSAASDGENIYVAFYDAREGRNAVSALKIQADGKIQPPVKISEGRGGAVNPRTISYGRKILTLWRDSASVYGKFTDINSDPPEVYSSTHPENRWSRLSSAEIRWKTPYDESGIEGYAVTVNKERFFNPAVVNAGPAVTSYRIPFLDDGITYFHIRTVDKAGNYSRTLTYPVMCSLTQLPMPDVSSLTHPEGKDSQSDSPEFSWKLEDDIRVKGYFYGISQDRPVLPKTFTEKTEAVFSGLPRGRYFFTVKALDKTDNPGKIAVYELIVGSAAKLDPDEYKRIAKLRDDYVKPEIYPSHAVSSGRKKYPDYVLEITGNTALFRVKDEKPLPGYFRLALKKGGETAVFFDTAGTFRIKDLPSGGYEFLLTALPENGTAVSETGTFRIEGAASGAAGVTFRDTAFFGQMSPVGAFIIAAFPVFLAVFLFAGTVRNRILFWMFKRLFRAKCAFRKMINF